MQVRNESVPKQKMHQFHEILCATGGRYMNNPRECGDVMRVDYIPGDYTKQCILWDKVNTNIVEKRSDQKWRKIYRRFIEFMNFVRG